MLRLPLAVKPTRVEAAMANERRMSDSAHHRAASAPVTRCIVCGSEEMHYVEELSAALVREWELSTQEAAYVNRQQGLQCVRCGSTLRCMALATALLRHCGAVGTFAAFSASPQAQRLRVLEINEAGGVSPFLVKLPGHVFVKFPDVDMQHLPHPDGMFDLVVHSDTLEHVPDPLQGLAECRRVLLVGGACVFTVPIIVGRLTRSRAGLAPSHHGNPESGDGYLVHTEFGADAWTWPIAAGFSDCRIVSLEHPAAHALIAVR
jgi:SAM-dependent methyltransferase